MSTFEPPTIPSRDELERRLSAVTFSLEQRVIFVLHLLHQYDPAVNAVRNLTRENEKQAREIAGKAEKIARLDSRIEELETELRNRPVALPEIPAGAGELETELMQAVAQVAIR